MGIPPIQLDTLSMPDTLILMVLALVVFGPRRLPKIGRQLGKLMYEFRKASNDFKFQMEEELRQSEEADRRKKEEEERQRALAAAPPPPQLEQTTSQVAETTPSASEPEPSAPTTAESPYPYESNDPYRAQEESTSNQGTASDQTSSEPETAPEQTPPLEESGSEFRSDHSVPAPQDVAPRIQPPSSGETVAAKRPAAQPEQQELFAPPISDSANSPDSVTPEAERSEPAAHHANTNG